MSDVRKRLTAAVARAEYLHERNTQQGEKLRQVAGQMADHATKHVDEIRPKILAGDDTAAATGRRALRERYQARRLASS